MILVEIPYNNDRKPIYGETFNDRTQYREILIIKCIGSEHPYQYLDSHSGKYDVIEETFYLKDWTKGDKFAVPEWTYKIEMTLKIDDVKKTFQTFWCEGRDVFIAESDVWQRTLHRFNGELFKSEKALKEARLKAYIDEQEKIVKEYHNMNININDIPNKNLSKYIINKYKTKDTSNWKKDYHVFNH